jgi:hypothetical protein
LRALREQCTAELQRLAAEFEGNVDAARREWESRFGEPYPDSIEALSELAVRAGLDPNTVFSGTWTAHDVLPVIRGYLARQRERGAENDAPSPWDRLTDRQRGIMLALRDLAAVDADRRRSAVEIAEHAEGPGVTPENLKHALAALVKAGLLAARRGPSGGYWITLAGLALLPPDSAQ